MATPARISDTSAICVIVGLTDNSDLGSILRLSNRPGVKQSGVGPSAGLNQPFDGAEDALFDERLTDSIQLVHRISVDQVGSEIRGTESAGGSIDFTIGLGNIKTRLDSVNETAWDSEIWRYLRLLWKGANILVYEGATASTNFSDFSVIYSGIVDDFTHDLSTASIKLGGVARTLNTTIQPELYIDGVDPTSVVGKPKPVVWGYTKQVKPVLYDEVNQIYHVSVVGTTPRLSSVDNLTVGGMPWTKLLAGSVDPNVPGEWTVDLTNGTIQLSGPPMGEEVRCDVKSYTWDVMTTAELIKIWLTPKNITYDTTTFDALDVDVPGLVGYAATELTPVNLQTAIDEAMLGAGGFWTESDDGVIKVYSIKTPAVSTDDATYDLAGINADGILDIRLVTIPPRAWRVRAEYNRKWSTLNNFTGAVSEEVQLDMSEPGDVSGSLEDTDLRDGDVTSIDPPLVRTLFNDLNEAAIVHNRLLAAWGVERRVYEIVLGTKTNVLYKTINIDYKMIDNKMFRITSIQRNLGAGTCTIQVWG